MPRYNSYGAHTVTELSVHLVWVTKYRYPILVGDIQKRCRDLIRQICDAEDVRILKGVVSHDHIHIHVSRPPRLSESELVRKLKGRTGRKLLLEYPELKRRYWGGHFWAIGFGAWSTGNITKEMVNEYLKHHNQKPNLNDKDFILEE
jgi:putative transposase